MKTIKEFWKEFLERWKATSPKFFKKLKKYALIVGGSAGAMLTVIGTFGLVVPATVTTILTYTIILSAGVAGTSQLTKE